MTMKNCVFPGVINKKKKRDSFCRPLATPRHLVVRRVRAEAKRDCAEANDGNRECKKMEIQECKDCGVTALGNRVDDMKDFGN